MTAHIPISFLFTDIEGSTPMWETARSAMESAVARHEQLLAEAIESHGGRVVKTLGDGLYAVFGRPEDAVEAAAVGMRALLEEPWHEATPIRVRMGIHTGAAEERAGDFYGPSVNRAARVMGAGHGGQIVVSSATAAELVDSVPAGHVLRDLGEVRLRGLATAEHLHQLVGGSLPEQFPPVTGSDIPSNLPATPTTFVGRNDEFAAVADLLDGNRLVTLLGFGGTGKTRLAIEVAAHVTATYPDGVWFVDVAPVRGPELVAQTTAATMGIAEVPGEDVAATVAANVGEGRVLLVLDNCEQVIEGAAALAASLIGATGRLRVIATSRAPLSIKGEAIYELDPLDVRTDGPAYRLFVDRARAVRHGFAPSTSDHEAIDKIVRDLDGIPLAIELAAARVRMMDPDQIAGRLDRRFDLLVGGDRAAHPRQQTLRALIEWSYQLLDEADRDVFDRLAVFAGSFTLEAAEAVAGEPDNRGTTFDILARLIDQSLVRRHASEDELRFDMLETLRRFGRDQLEAGGIESELKARHARYFAARMADADQRLKGPDQDLWHNSYVADEANLFRALEWLAANDPDVGLEVASQIARLWYRRGMVTLGEVTLRSALDASSPPATEAKARAIAWRAFFTDLLGDGARARAMVAEAVAMAEGVASPEVLAQALNAQAGFVNNDGSLRRAVALWQAALDALDGAGSEWVTAPLFNLGYGLVELGELEQARPIVGRLIDIGTRNGDRWTQSIGELLSAYVAFGADELERADALADAARDAFEEQGAVFHAVEACVLRASIAEVQGDVVTAKGELKDARAAIPDAELFERAEALVLEGRIELRSGSRGGALAALGRAIDADVDDDNPLTTARILYLAARLAHDAERSAEAAELVGAAQRAVEVADVRPAAYIVREAMELLGALDTALPPGRMEELRRRGYALAPDDAMALAQTLV